MSETPSDDRTAVSGCGLCVLRARCACVLLRCKRTGCGQKTLLAEHSTGPEITHNSTSSARDSIAVVNPRFTHQYGGFRAGFACSSCRPSGLLLVRGVACLLAAALCLETHEKQSAALIHVRTHTRKRIQNDTANDAHRAPSSQQRASSIAVLGRNSDAPLMRAASQNAE